MSADKGVDAGAPNLNLTPEEKRVYGQLFRQADTESVGVVTGEIAVKFFEQTRLDSSVLGEIWQIADKENRGFLTPAGFGMVLRLIGHAQAGRDPQPELALQPGPIPRFSGFFPNVSSPPSSPTALQAQGTGNSFNRMAPLTPDKASQYAALFERQSLQNGRILSGEQARSIFDKSGLPNEVLGKIWELSDTEQRGALVQTEFIIAMHLLTSMRTGAMRSLPNVLPAALFEAANNRGQAARPSSSSAGPGISAIPRQMSGSTQPRTGSPLGRPPMSPSQGAGESGWLVTPTEKAKFDHIYATLDKGNKGYITGEEAVPFFSQSNLSEDNLAQVWDLADFNSQGTLTREGFAVAMYLIREHRSGRMQTLPQSLPEGLKPPSIRGRAQSGSTAPAETASAFAPPPMQKPPPPQPKSALDDLFGLDSSASSPAAPTQAPMSTGNSAGDPFAGGSLPPSSPTRQTTTGSATGSGSTFKPFVPSSSFGRGLTVQGTGDSTGSASRHAPASDDLLSDNDEASKNISGESTELANLSNQVGSLSKQMQDTQAKRTNTQNELNQTNSQKQNFEQRLAQLRAAYEKEAKDTQALEETLRKSRKDTAKLQSECMSLEGQLRDSQQQHQQMQSALQTDQQENANLRERIRVANAEIAQLKPRIDKLKSDARQQKGLVAINKKQLSTTEGERDKLKSEADDLTRSAEDTSRDVDTSSPVPVAAQITSPALSSASGNNPFFKRTASTDIMGVVASPPPRNMSDTSFDDVFGPSSTSAAPPIPGPAPAAIKQQDTGNTSDFSTPPATSPSVSRQATMTTEPPAPPESRQMSSSFLPLPEHNESLTSSREVSPPASRADGAGKDVANPFPTSPAEMDKGASLPGAFPGDEEDKDVNTATAGSPSALEADKVESREMDTDIKAKADFDNAFAAFTTSKKSQPESASEQPKPKSTVDTEFPPITEMEQDSESDSDTDEGGFDDDFAPASPEDKKTQPKTPPAFGDVVPEASSKDAAAATGSGNVVGSHEQPASPATITNQASEPATAAATTQPTRGAFDDLDDDFEGLEDAKEGSADDDFANISRSGLDDFNTVFDNSPSASQTKSESTAFGHESGFDFVSHGSATGVPTGGSSMAAKGSENHDWDAIFAGLDEPAATTEPASRLENPTTTGMPASATVPAPPKSRPATGRALTQTGEHDDPILKNLTGMGYSRSDALSALEKYDYNLERAANYLASQS